MKKKALVLSLVVVLVAVAALGATLAYFTDKDEATNTFTVGNVKIELKEPKWNNVPFEGEEDDFEEYAYTGQGDAETVYAGEALGKDPTVKNVGANPCLVRIKVVMPEVQGLTNPVSIDGPLGADWVQYGEYYYYMKPIGDPIHGISDRTTPLFQQIRVSYDLENGDAVKEYNVKVYAEALQAQGVFPQWADMKDGIEQDDAPNYRTEIEFDIVKALFDAEF